MKILLLLLPLLQAAPAKADPRAGLVVTLGDGSSFHADPAGETLLVRTEYGEQKIPVAGLRSLRRINDLEFQVRTDKVALSGEVVAKDLRLRTEIGPIQVPLGEVRAITSGGGPSLLADLATVALWDLGEVRGGVCHDLVKNRPLTLNEFDSGEDAGGLRTANRKGEDSFAEAAADDDLEQVTNDFTVEVRFKTAASPRGYTAILSKNERTSGSSSDYCLFVQSNGTLNIQSISNRGTVSLQTPTPIVRFNEWTYLALVVQPQRQVISVYINGKMAFQQNHPYYAVPSNSPLFVGTSPPYRGSFGCADKFQFVRISKTARSPEEIAELQSLLESQLRLGFSGAARGIVFRDGGFLRAEFPRLVGTKFRTAYGTLTIGETMAGEVKIYRFREAELESVKKSVRELIPKLGAGGIEEREEAHTKILEAAEAGIPLLREALKSKDSEVRSRVEGILKKFDETGVTGRPIGDSLRMGQTVLFGWIDASSVEVVTRFGTVPVTIDRIGRLNLGERQYGSRSVMKLRTGESIQTDAPRGTALDLETGFGALSVPLKDVVSLSYDAAKSEWTIRTDRLTAKGKVGQGEMKVTTPAGTLQVPLAELQEIAQPRSP